MILLDANSVIMKLVSQKNFDFLSEKICKIRKFFWNI